MQPYNALPEGQSSRSGSSAKRQPRQRWISLLYAFGLLLVFLASLLLLPADAGVGKLLWGGLVDC